MADIFREVDEELRREQAQKLWQRYGTYVLAAAVLVVLATAGAVAWREWRDADLRAQGARLVAATELAAKGSTDEAIRSLDALAGEASDGYALLARLNEAALRAKQGDAAGAAALYEAIAADSDAPATYRDLAVLLLALNGFDSADPQAMIARLAPVTADGNPLRFSALEITALYERKAGNPARAREIYQQLAEAANVPAAMRERAREMLRLTADAAGGAKGAS